MNGRRRQIRKRKIKRIAKETKKSKERKC